MKDRRREGRASEPPGLSLSSGTAGGPPPQAGRAQQTLRANRDKIKEFEDLCDSLGESPAVVALAWLLHQEGVTAPIIGPRTIEQLDEPQRAVKLALGRGTLERLDAIFPGYQPAPEHYAW